MLSIRLSLFPIRSLEMLKISVTYENSMAFYDLTGLPNPRFGLTSNPRPNMLVSYVNPREKFRRKSRGSNRVAARHLGPIDFKNAGLWRAAWPGDRAGDPAKLG